MCPCTGHCFLCEHLQLQNSERTPNELRANSGQTPNKLQTNSGRTRNKLRFASVRMCTSAISPVMAKISLFCKKYNMRTLGCLIFIVAIGCIWITNHACLATKGPKSHTKRNAFDGSDCQWRERPQWSDMMPWMRTWRIDSQCGIAFAIVTK